MKPASTLRFLLVVGLLASLNACVLVIPWHLAWGGWREGIPHDPLLFKDLPSAQARQAAAGALIGLREKPYHLKDVRVVPAVAANSVLLMASLPFNPPNPPKDPDGETPYYKDAVLPVFVKVNWTVGGLTHFEVAARVIRSPFHAGWEDYYEATGSADATPAYLMRRASDLRTVEDARRMDQDLDRLSTTLEQTVRADLPWVVEEVSR